MSWLIGLIDSLFGRWLSFKSSRDEALGKAEQSSEDIEKYLNCMKAQQKAAADSPTSMEQLIKEQKEGKV